MITPNTKVTAADVVEELGLENARDLFGTTRIRIGGISGINKADQLINIMPETKVLEVIVGNEIYELELAEGDEDDNAETKTVTPAAQAAIEEKGREATRKAEKLQEVKALAAKLRDASLQGEEYVPTKQEEKLIDKAVGLNQSHAEALAAREALKSQRQTIKVKSK